MNLDRAYNKRREASNLVGSVKEKRKKYRDIVKELGVRHITLDDISKGKKELGLLEVLGQNGATLDEFVVLQQYARAIIDRDTKSAEFLRDTVGEKPTTQIDVSDEKACGIAQMTLEQLIALKDALEKGE